jgi:hypothetical protein
MDKTDIAHASNQYVEKLNIVLKTLTVTPQKTDNYFQDKRKIISP